MSDPTHSPPQPRPRSGDGRAEGAATARRVGDAERRRTEALLATALSLGHLQPDELDDRLDQVLRARTEAELDVVTLDLPVAELRRHDPAVARRRRQAVRRGLVAHAVLFVVMSTLVVGTWLAVALGTGVWFPWAAFPVLGGLAGLGAHAGVVRSGAWSRRPAPPAARALPRPALTAGWPVPCLSAGRARGPAAGPRR